MKNNVIKKIVYIESAYNEFFCEILAKKLGIKCAHYKYAKTKNQRILISKNFLKENETLIEACSFIKDQKNSLDVLLKSLKKAEDYYAYKIDKEQIELDLFKIIVFDYLTSQVDRHDKNYGFIASQKNNETHLCVAPIYDNEHCFGLTHNGLQKNNSGDFDIGKIINTPMCFGIYDGYINQNLNSTGIEQHVYAREIVDYAIKKPCLEQFLKQCLKSSTINECIEEIKKIKPKINNKQINLYKICLTIKISTLLNTYNHVKNLKNNKRNEFINACEM